MSGHATFSTKTTEVELELLGLLKAAPYVPYLDDTPESKTYIYVYTYRGLPHALIANTEFLDVYAPYKEYFHDSHLFTIHITVFFAKTSYEREVYESE